jgi:multidrug resistance efflux pump
MRNLARFTPLLLLVLAGCDMANGAVDAGSVTLLPAPTAFVATSVGRVDSAGEARQLVAATDGVIAQVRVMRGQQVTAGQVLLTVDCGPRTAIADANRAMANRMAAAAQTTLAGARNQQITAATERLKSAAAVRADASERLQQAQALITQGFVSRREYSARQNALASADAALHEAQANASLISEGPRPSERREAVAAADAAQFQAQSTDAEARQCALRSPISGSVLQILRREGEFSGGSQGVPLIIVGDLSRMIVRAEINERDAAKVVAGQAAEVWIEGGATRWQGRVTSLAYVMGRQTARSLDPTDRFDRDTREAFVSIDTDAPPSLVGLRVLVGFHKRSQQP